MLFLINFKPVVSSDCVPVLKQLLVIYSVRQGRKSSKQRCWDFGPNICLRYFEAYAQTKAMAVKFIF